MRTLIFCSFIVILTLVSCQEKGSQVDRPEQKESVEADAPFRITCKDLYSKTHQVMDNGLKLEINEVSDGKYEANLFQVGFAGPVSLRKISVTKVPQQNSENVFKGEKFYFVEKDLNGELEIQLDEAISTTSHETPTNILKEKFVCQRI